MTIEALALAAPAAFAAAAGASFVAPELLRRRSVGFRRLAAAIAAAGAVFAHTHSSGWFVADVLLGPALAAAVTLLAARARTRTMCIAAMVAAVLSVASASPSFGFAAAGAAVAVVLTGRRAPVLVTAVGAALVNATLRLELPGPAAVELVASSALLAPVVLSGYAGMRGQTRQRLRAAVAGGGAAAVAVALLGALALVLARPSLESAVRHATLGIEAARAADQGTAGAELEEAQHSFDDGHRSLTAFWVRPAYALPLVGPHLRALEVVSTTGTDLARAGRGVADAADLNGLRIVDGQVPLDRIAALTRPVGEAAAGVASALPRLRRARSPWLVGPVAERLDANLDRLDDAGRSLRTSKQVVAVLPDMLGAHGPRRWFLAVQTPSEARGTGGFIGNYGEITAEGGRLGLPRFGRIQELNESGVPVAQRTLSGPADYIARYARFGVAGTWQNVTFSPDFPSVSEVIAGLYPQSGGRPVDGVIAVDPAAIAALLALTGPISVEPWPEPLTSENAERVLLYEQYVRFPDIAQRVDFLGDATQLLWERLTSGELPPARDILAALGPAVAEKHLMVSSLDAAEGAALASAGIDGRMLPVRGDALAVVTQNANGNKIDWFLERSIDYRPSVDPATGAIHARLSVTLDNTSPAGGVPGYIIASLIRPPLPMGTNRLYLSVYTPWRVTAATSGGRALGLESERELGRNVFSTYVELPPGSSTRVELELAGNLPDVAAGRPYVLDVHAQPLVRPDRLTVHLDGHDARHLELDRDRTLRMAPG